MSFSPRFICAHGNFSERHILGPEYLNILVGLHSDNARSLNAQDLLTSELVSEGLLGSDANGEIYNNSMVISASDGGELFTLADQFSGPVQQIMRLHLPAVQRATSAIPEFSFRPFSEYSFLILSNVVLDNWQIRNVEELYLNQNRPLRGGKQFYFAIMENSPDCDDPFGIYGNISRPVENDFCSFYGNNQRSLSSADFIELPRKNGVLKLSQNANQALSKVAHIVCNDLIGIFKDIDGKLRSYHEGSRWARVSYAEFFIWWYHFLYTQVTNDLAEAGDLIIPENRMYPYIVTGEQ